MAKSRNKLGAEKQRLDEDSRRTRNWKRWGAYLPERQWGTVREDYSADGDCWAHFPREQARSRAYRWGEDGLLGLTDREGRLCFALALWNGRDPILKERLFGLGNREGNHGEDVKECYYYLEATPTYSYAKALYKYPQAEFPYARLLDENRRRGRKDPEFELADTGVFDENRYFDVFVEYAKRSPNDVLIRLTAANRGPEAATLDLLPTLWFRNTWVWGCAHEGCTLEPRLQSAGESEATADHETLGRFRFVADRGPDGRPPRMLFTNNETNAQRVFGTENPRRHVKDAFHDAVIAGRTEAVNEKGHGTKTAAWYHLEVPAGESVTVRLRLFAADEAPRAPFGPQFDRTFAQRLREADEFYDESLPPAATPEARNIARQGFAGLLWSTQFYHYVVEDWLRGDADQPPPPESRKQGRNHDWRHLFNRGLISAPDKWEFPWYAAWDLAFHMVLYAEVDPHFAKEQLLVLLREWFMHPNGQLPGCEFDLSEVNPPVHAWACWRVYKITGPRGRRDRLFLARAFQKLLLNFTWWVNRKDLKGNHIFSGGFLGLDNIGVFDRSQPLPAGGHLEQADGSAWMAFYCATMLSMALELALEDPSYEDLASKFFEHFVAITDAMNSLGGAGLWNEDDGFYYDQISLPADASARGDAPDRAIPLRVRSLVGLIPLMAAEVLDQETIDRLPGFRKRTNWFLENRKDLARHISYLEVQQADGNPRPRRLLAIPSRDRLVRVLKYMLDENEFLSPFGVRSLSRYHLDHPFVLRIGGRESCVGYAPGEAEGGLFGGNSNWRGPVWLPVNYLLIEALERYHLFYGDTLRVECPTGSGRMMTLDEVAHELSRRLTRLFLPDAEGRRPSHGGEARYAGDPHWRDLVLFYEYFHGETGRGLGATHQTGWTSLVVRLLEDLVRCRRL